MAFLVPLFILVSDLARDAAISDGERDAESLARAMSVLTVNQGLEEAVEVIGEDRIAEVNGSVVFEDGRVFGISLDDEPGDLSLAEQGNSFVTAIEDGAAVYVPVLTAEGTAVVRVFVPTSAIRDGVVASWVVLGVLGLALIALAAWVADRLGRSMVQPVKELSDTAERLGSGDLTVRVTPSGPPEIEEVGIEFNRLADQIGRLLQEERETAADLAHRLRTPLTAARLTVDGLDDSPHKDRLIADLDELQRTTNFIIREARRPIRQEEAASCDVGTVAAERAAFWEPLATEQERTVTVDITNQPTPVSIPQVDLETAIDALIENAISHTPAGSPFWLIVERIEDIVHVSVVDGGGGLPKDFILERGSSGGGSTGLGLDIVRRTVESVDGSLLIGTSDTLGGASVRITLPISGR
jgi:signal transduction histidine kinase